MAKVAKAIAWGLLGIVTLGTAFVFRKTIAKEAARIVHKAKQIGK